MTDLFGKYCYINTPWVAGEKTRYRIIGGNALSNVWCDVPVGAGTDTKHDHKEEVVFAILDTLVDDTSIIRRFALKDVKLIEQNIEYAKCTHGDGVVFKPDGINELDPCVYKEIQAFRNVTVRILKCVHCGHIDIEWVRQENTEDITDDES